MEGPPMLNLGTHSSEYPDSYYFASQRYPQRYPSMNAAFSHD
jgi:hypothetical protein